MRRALWLLTVLLSAGSAAASSRPMVLRLDGASGSDPAVAEARRLAGTDRSATTKTQVFANEEQALHLNNNVVGREVWVSQGSAEKEPATSLFRALQAVDASTSNFAAGVHVVLGADARARYGEQFLRDLFGALNLRSLHFAGSTGDSSKAPADATLPADDNVGEVPLLLAMDSHPQLARELANKLDLRAEGIAAPPDGKFDSRVLPKNPRRRRVLIVGSKRVGGAERFHEDLLDTLHTAWLAKRQGAERVTLISPYLPYSRSDRIDGPGGTIGIAVLAQLMKGAGIDDVVSYSVHQPQELAAFQALHMQMAHVSGEGLLAKRVASHAARLGINPGQLAVVSPDAGGTKRAGVFARALERALKMPPKSLQILVANKERDGNATTTRFDGNVAGMTVVAIDDETASGGTLRDLASAALEHGAARAWGAVSHVTGAAGKALAGSNLERLFVLDTLPQARQPPNSRLEVIPVAGHLARVTRALDDGRGLRQLLFYEHL